VDGWMDAWVEGWMDGCTVCTYICMYGFISHKPNSLPSIVQEAL